MRVLGVLTAVGFCLTTTSGFSASYQASISTSAGLVDVDERAPRDVYSMSEWAKMCGTQLAEGFQLVSSPDGQDFSVITQQDMPAGTPVVFVPKDMVLASYQPAQEYGTSVQPAETAILQSGYPETVLPHFRLFFKILAEYEKGQQSPWYAWLNSLPRLFNTGAAMTDACFKCLPPYAAGLATNERKKMEAFIVAAKLLPLQRYETCSIELLKWAYNVANTRSVPLGQDWLIAPMADMFNHGAYPSVQINYDEQGNCMVYTTRDVQAGSPLEVSLGDPLDPSPLFARYGFFDDTSPASFCKLMQYQDEMRQLGYTYSNLLFYKETGDISMEVYDVLLYAILLKNDANLAQGFYQAVTTSDEASKTQYHQQYFAYTKEELQKHVDGTLKNLDEWNFKARSYDPQTHPRVPVILKHNAFVRDTFMRVKQNLERM